MKKILVALDLGTGHEEVLDRTVELARAVDGRVWLLHVAPSNRDSIGFEAGPQHVHTTQEHRYRDEHRHVQKAADGLRARRVDATTLLVKGSMAETIIAEAERLDVDVIVMGSHGRGALYRTMLGSVSSAVLKKTTLPVLVVPIRED